MSVSWNASNIAEHAGPQVVLDTQSAAPSFSATAQDHDVGPRDLVAAEGAGEGFEQRNIEHVGRAVLPGDRRPAADPLDRNRAGGFFHSSSLPLNRRESTRRTSRAATRACS